MNVLVMSGNSLYACIINLIACLLITSIKHYGTCTTEILCLSVELNCVNLKDEENKTSQASLAYKVLSAQHTKKLMNTGDVNDLAWLVICFVVACICMCVF